MSDLSWLSVDEGHDKTDDVVEEMDSITALRQTTLTLGEDDTYNLVLNHTLTYAEHGNGAISKEDKGYALSLALGTTNLETGKVEFGKPLPLMDVQAGVSSPDLPLGPMGEKTFETLTHFMQEGRQADLESVANAVAAYYGHTPKTEPDSRAERIELNENLGMVRAGLFDGSPDVALEAARRAAPYLSKPFADVEHTAAVRTSVRPWTPAPVAQPAVGPADGVGISSVTQHRRDPIGRVPWIQPPETTENAQGAFFAFPISDGGLCAMETHIGPVGQEVHRTILDLIDSRRLDDSLTDEEREKLLPLTEEQWDRQLARVQETQLNLYRGAAVDGVLVPNKFGTPIERQITLERNSKTPGPSDDENRLAGFDETLVYAERMYQAVCYLEGSPERAAEEPFLDGFTPWPDEEIVPDVSLVEAAPETDAEVRQTGPDLDF